MEKKIKQEFMKICIPDMKNNILLAAIRNKTNTSTEKNRWLTVLRDFLLKRKI